MRVIAFRVWGDYAHFRRHFTTSSPLTHSIPPPSALRGLVGAILGFSREEYPEKLSLDKSLFGVRLLRPVKKVRLGVNYIDTKDGAWVSKPPKGRLHTQVRMEFLKDPDFEVYFHHEDDGLMDGLSERLVQHRAVYTLYLGITECIANFEFFWDGEVQPFEGVSNVLSAFKLDYLKTFKLETGTGIVRERVPLLINAERERLDGDEVAFNPYAGPIPAEVENVYLYPGERDRTIAFIG